MLVDIKILLAVHILKGCDDQHPVVRIVVGLQQDALGFKICRPGCHRPALGLDEGLVVLQVGRGEHRVVHPFRQADACMDPGKLIGFRRRRRHQTKQQHQDAKQKK